MIKSGLTPTYTILLILTGTQIQIDFIQQWNYVIIRQRTTKRGGLGATHVFGLRRLPSEQC